MSDVGALNAGQRSQSAEPLCDARALDFFYEDAETKTQLDMNRTHDTAHGRGKRKRQSRQETGEQTERVDSRQGTRTGVRRCTGA
eukprot:scaffold1316_cov130-Isochrysis_galbana.AAC.12